MSSKKVLNRSLWLGLILALVLFNFSYAESSESWNTPPIITEAYEQEPGKIYLEWVGTASLYQVYMDGKKVASVNVTSALIDVKKGAHTVKIIPVRKQEGSDINMGVANLNFGFTLSETVTGTASEPLSFDYLPSVLNGITMPAPLAKMSSDSVVLLSFLDKYSSDEYLISINEGGNIGYIRFFPNDVGQNEYITKDGPNVLVRLDPNYLIEKSNVQIELGKKYTFAIQLRKYTKSLLNGEKITYVVQESRAGKGLEFIPVEAWSVAPIISQALQNGEGQAVIKWDHNPGNGIQCEYNVVLVGKVLGVKTNETVVATTKEKQVIINDLVDGQYCYTIVPRYNNRNGSPSLEANVTIKNSWDLAPNLVLTQVASNQVRLNWDAVAGIEAYHIKVLAGDNKSLLQFVDLDYKDYKEFEVPVSDKKMETLFTYDDEIDLEKGVKLKFEIWGTKKAVSGDELTTKVKSETITIK